MRYQTVVMGVSAGGMAALNTILPELPGNFPLAVIIVQHTHPTSDDFLARYLDEQCTVDVKEADEKEKILPGVVYLAPPNYHLLVEHDKTLSFSTELPVNFARPSIDVLFETAAEAYGEKVVGVILTGANHDGSQGLSTIKKAGGLVVVQDPETAEVDAMPRSAIETVQPDHILPLERIGSFLSGLVSVPYSPKMVG
jgi:two-component system chemotaxis response regulator CheB